MKNYLKPYILTGVALLSTNSIKAIDYSKTKKSTNIVEQSSEECSRVQLESNREYVINRAGTYIYSGTVSNSKIVIETASTDRVEVILDEVRIEKSDTILEIKEGSHVVLSVFNRNILTSTGESPVVLSKTPITLNGLGSILIKSDCGDGVDISGELSIEGGYLTIDAHNDGIRGLETLNLYGGDTAIKAGNSTISDSCNIVREGGYLELLG